MMGFKFPVKFELSDLRDRGVPLIGILLDDVKNMVEHCYLSYEETRVSIH